MDWYAAQSDEAVRESRSWTDFLADMRAFYRPTDNPTLKNFKFRELQQGPEETFTAFCNRVALEAGHCSFKCTHGDCTAEDTATRDQIVIGTRYHHIREEALLKSWDLATLRTDGMKMESALKSGCEIGGEQVVNKLGKYSYKNTKSKPTSTINRNKPNKSCYRCGETFTTYSAHQPTCKGNNNTCSKCSTPGHLPSVCRKSSKINALHQVDGDSPSVASTKPAEEETKDTYSVNLFAIDIVDTDVPDGVQESVLPAIHNTDLLVVDASFRLGGPLFLWYGM